MASDSNLDVFILGAGCSRSSGFPLAEELGKGLRSFSAKIAESSPIISHWCTETVNLLEAYKIDTLDELANRLLSGALRSDKKDESSYWETAQKAVNRAKSAVSAYFLDLEDGALDLGAYKKFIDEHIPETGSAARIPADSKVRVLSFNYDRLFEIAFSQRFQDRRSTDDQMLHGEEWLNSGIAIAEDSLVIRKDRFSLLKMHGSIGHTVNGLFPESRNEMEFSARGLGRVVEDGNWDIVFTRKGSKRSSAEYVPRESTIHFPIEKSNVIRSVAESPLKPYDKRAYIHQVWAAADDFTTRARRITICGFSGRGKDAAFLERLILNAKDVESIRIYDPIAEEIAERVVGFRPKVESKVRAKHFLFWLRQPAIACKCAEVRLST